MLVSYLFIRILRNQLRLIANKPNKACVKSLNKKYLKIGLSKKP
jgi:hypothetical protein